MLSLHCCSSQLDLHRHGAEGGATFLLGSWCGSLEKPVLRGRRSLADCKVSRKEPLLREAMPLASARPLVRPVAAGDEVTRTQTSLSCRRCWKGTTNAVGGPSSDSSLLACHKHKHQHQQACRSRTHSPSWTTTRGPISYHGARWGRAAQRTRQQRSTPIQATASAATAAAAAAVVPDARAWILLLTAIVFEVLGTTCMKLSDGFQNPFFTVALVISYVASLLIFTHSLKYWCVSQRNIL